MSISSCFYVRHSKIKQQEIQSLECQLWSSFCVMANQQFTLVSQANLFAIISALPRFHPSFQIYLNKSKQSRNRNFCRKKQRIKKNFAKPTVAEGKFHRVQSQFSLQKVNTHNCKTTTEQNSESPYSSAVIAKRLLMLIF